MMTCTAFRGELKQRIEKARAVFDMFKAAHGATCNPVRLPTEYVQCTEKKRKLHTDCSVTFLVERSLIFIEIKSRLIEKGGRVLHHPDYVRHFSPWTGKEIYPDGREEYVEDDTKDAVLQILIRPRHPAGLITQ
jgi:hypothetical protein